MNTKDKLQLILITYNRSNHVKNTFKQFFAPTSPLKDYDFLVLDNNSTDDTEQVVKDFMKTHPTVRYQKNHYNLGISGNISKAMEIASKQYLWILGDDDIYDFSNWNEVERAIERNEKVICVARYAIPDDKKEDVAYQLFQCTFISGLITNTSLYTDTVMRNVFDSIYTLFPHMPPLMQLINDNGKIYVVDKAISDNGMDLKTTDCSYVRGTKANELYTRTLSMSWIVGYCNICSLLKDKRLLHHVINVSIQYIHNGDENFYNAMKEWYSNPNCLMQLIDLYMNMDKEHCKHLLPLIRSSLFNPFTHYIKKVKRCFFRVKQYPDYNEVRILFFRFKRKK